MTNLKPNKWFHLTSKHLGERVILQPSTDYYPPGISFAPNISRALEGIPSLYFRRVAPSGRPIVTSALNIKHRIGIHYFYVYTPTMSLHATKPDVEDIQITRERRTTTSAPVRLLGRIKVTSKTGRTLRWRWYERG